MTVQFFSLVSFNFFKWVKWDEIMETFVRTFETLINSHFIDGLNDKSAARSDGIPQLVPELMPIPSPTLHVIHIHKKIFLFNEMDRYHTMLLCPYLSRWRFLNRWIGGLAS